MNYEAQEELSFIEMNPKEQEDLLRFSNHQIRLIKTLSTLLQTNLYAMADGDAIIENALGFDEDQEEIIRERIMELVENL